MGLRVVAEWRGGGSAEEGLELEIDGVGPAEADDVLVVSGGDVEVL
jgi:hypothetical protein